MNDLFVIASREKYRFQSNKGFLGTEDLWDLSLVSLDKIAVGLDEEVNKAGGKSFIQKRAASTTEAANKLEIVKFVIATVQEEAEIAKTKANKKSQKEFLKSLLEKKKIAELEGLSVEEIEKQIAGLD